MPATISHATAEHRAEGFRSFVLPAVPHRPVRVCLPIDYQPKYAYPLIVLFHADGECEEHTARLVPLLSQRNYVGLCVRGPISLGPRADGRPAFGWRKGTDRGVNAALVHTMAQYNIHPDRVFLMGVCEGVAAAYRFALSRRVAGVVALNGILPVGAGANDLRLWIGHGTANPVVSLAEARSAGARLAAAGATVRVTRYSTSRRVHADMLRDANRWIMAQVAGKSDE